MIEQLEFAIMDQRLEALLGARENIDLADDVIAADEGWANRVRPSADAVRRGGLQALGTHLAAPRSRRGFPGRL